MSNPRAPQTAFEYTDYTPNILARTSPLLTPDHAQILLELQRSNNDLKRKVSQLSTHSSKSEALKFLNIRAKFIANLDQGLMATLDALKCVFPDKEAEKKMGKTIQDCREKRVRLAAEDVTIRRERHRILEEIMNVEVNNTEIDWVNAYAVVLTQELKGRIDAAESMRRHSHERFAWCNELKRKYDSHDPDHLGDLWCPVLQTFGAPDTRRCAHIVPWSLGYENIALLFGEASGHDVVSRYENALVLSKMVERALDEFWIAIVPIVTDPMKPQRWKVVLMDETKRDVRIGGGDRRWGSLHDKELQFRSDFRPGKRFLYYQFIVSMLKLVRLGTKGQTEKQIQLMTGEIWASPGNYLNRAILAKLGELLGEVKLSKVFLDAGTFRAPHNITVEEVHLVAKDLMVHVSKVKLVEDQESEEELEGFEEFEAEDEDEHSDFEGFGDY